MEFKSFPVTKYLYPKELSLAWYGDFVKGFKDKNGDMYIDLDGLAKVSGATTVDVDNFITQRATTLGLTEAEILIPHEDFEGEYRLVKMSEIGKFLVYLFDTGGYQDASIHLEYLANLGTKRIYK